MKNIFSKKWGGAFGLLLLVAGVAYAQQTIYYQTLSGNETWVAGNGASGSSAYLRANLLRNTQAVTINSNVVGTVQLTVDNSDYILTAQPASALTLTLPVSPCPDGQIFELINGTTAAFATQVITIQPAAGQTLVGGNVTATTLAAKASVEFRYSLATNSWYQLR